MKLFSMQRLLALGAVMLSCVHCGTESADVGVAKQSLSAYPGTRHECGMAPGGGASYLGPDGVSVYGHVCVRSDQGVCG